MSGPQGFFLRAAPGQRHGLYHAPAAGAVRGPVLQIHAFAEELNKTRRMAALQARALAAAGHPVLQMDLLGCGDSAGDFADARWDLWLDDLQAGLAWLQQRHPGAPAPWLWGIRAGCLLAADLARKQQDTACHLLFWQASFAEGAMQLQQFLRLRLAADLLTRDGGDSQGQRQTMEGLRAQLADGQALDIAGYTLSPALAAGLQSARLTPAAPAPTPASRLVWLEVSSQPGASPGALGTRTLQGWRDAGWTTEASAVPGPAFWQTTEIEEAPALLAATLHALGQDGAP